MKTAFTSTLFTAQATYWSPIRCVKNEFVVALGVRTFGAPLHQVDPLPTALQGNYVSVNYHLQGTHPKICTDHRSCTALMLRQMTARIDNEVWCRHFVRENANADGMSGQRSTSDVVENSDSAALSSSAQTNGPLCPPPPRALEGEGCVGKLKSKKRVLA